MKKRSALLQKQTQENVFHQPVDLARVTGLPRNSSTLNEQSRFNFKKCGAHRGFMLIGLTETLCALWSWRQIEPRFSIGIYLKSEIECNSHWAERLTM